MSAIAAGEMARGFRRRGVCIEQASLRIDRDDARPNGAEDLRRFELHLDQLCRKRFPARACQPADAEVFIDGQRWQTPDAKGHPLEVRVPPGRVRVEVRKPGHTSFSTEVTVEPGQITPLNVSLPSQGEKL